jgi:hypothetical protein
LQYVCPAVAHTHCPDRQVDPPVHAFPHAPQLLLSVCVLTHAPLQNVAPVVAQAQAPFWQVAPPEPLHVVPHPPQLALSLFKLTHAPLQSVRFPVHMAAHLPRLQTTCPPDGPEHALLHAPQLLRLDAISTH